jgi:hypothetical protein
MTAISHPVWCHAAFCDAGDPDLPALAGGTHYSQPIPMLLPGVLGEQHTAVAQLRAPIGPWHGGAVLALTVGTTPTLLLRLDALPAALADLAALLASAGVEVRPDA